MSSLKRFALTISQPWASLIAIGIKDIENRSWMPSSLTNGDKIVIHASKQYDYLGAFMLMNDHGIVCHAQNFPRGAIVGTAVLAEVVEQSTSMWFRGPYGWRFTDMKMLEPIPCGGSQRLWAVPDAIWERVLVNEQLPLNPSAFTEERSICKSDHAVFV